MPARGYIVDILCHHLTKIQMYLKQPFVIQNAMRLVQMTKVSKVTNYPNFDGISCSRCMRYFFVSPILLQFVFPWSLIHAYS